MVYFYDIFAILAQHGLTNNLSPKLHLVARPMRPIRPLWISIPISTVAPLHQFTGNTGNRNPETDRPCAATLSASPVPSRLKL